MATSLSMSRPSLSRHLRVLRTAGLISQELVAGDGRARMVELQRPPFTALRSWVEEVEAFWGDQLAAFKAHAEGTHRRRRRR